MSVHDLPAVNASLNALSGIFADVAIVGTNGIDPVRGLTTPDMAEAAVKRAMLRAARRKVVLADHTKFGADHFAQFAAMMKELKAVAKAIGRTI